MESAVRWLRASYITGAIADCVIAVLMLLPGRMAETEFRLSMGLAASLMFGWSALLVWAYKSPIERKGVLVLTIFPVISGLVATEAWAATAGHVALQEAIASSIVGIMISILMGYSYWKATVVRHCRNTQSTTEPERRDVSTGVAKPAKVAIIGASGTYGTGILARAEEIGIEAVVVTRSPHKFKDVKPTTTVVEAQLDEEQKLIPAFAGCDGVISALGDDRKKRPKTHNLPHVWNAMKAASVTKYVGMASGAMMMPGENRGVFQRAVHPVLGVLKLFGVDFLEQNEWERDSLLMGKNGADGITWVITRVVRPTDTPFVGASAHKDKRGPLNCSIYDHGDFCLYCLASSEWDKLAPHVSSGPQAESARGAGPTVVAG